MNKHNAEQIEMMLRTHNIRFSMRGPNSFGEFSFSAYKVTMKEIHFIRGESMLECSWGVLITAKEATR